eukprot:29471-Pelagococcus_subviridis.AAC.1
MAGDRGGRDGRIDLAESTTLRDATPRAPRPRRRAQPWASRAPASRARTRAASAGASRSGAPSRVRPRAAGLRDARRARGEDERETIWRRREGRSDDMRRGRDGGRASERARTVVRHQRMMRVDLVRALQHRRQLPRRHRARRTRRDARACALVAKLSIPLLATHARATRAACSESRAETLDRDWRDERRYHADELDTTDQRRRYHRSNAKRPACVFASFREKSPKVKSRSEYTLYDTSRDFGLSAHSGSSAGSAKKYPRCPQPAGCDSRNARTAPGTRARGSHRRAPGSRARTNAPSRSSSRVRPAPPPRRRTRRRRDARAREEGEIDFVEVAAPATERESRAATARLRRARARRDRREKARTP